MRRQRLRAMDVYDVDNQSVADTKCGRGGLRQKQRRLEVSAHQIVPINLGDVTHGRRIARRCIVDQYVERAEVARRYVGEHPQLTDVEQVRLDEYRGVW